jgi:N-acetylmuramoyl-L-alanine amidase
MIYLVTIEGGHGLETKGKETPFMKELGRKIKEVEFNDPVVAVIIEELKRHGVHTYDVAPGTTDAPLSVRVSKTNEIYKDYCSKYGKENVKAIHLSIHFNAFDGTFDGRNPSGFSVHINPGSVGSRKLAECIIGELKNGTKQINRGIIEQNLYITKNTIVPAALSENGFMDNPFEASLMLNEDFQKEVGIEHVKGILKYFGLKYIELKIEEEDEMLEKAIVINSFADFPSAEGLAYKLQAPIYLKSIAKSKQVAKEIYICGGTEEGIKGEKFTVLSGADRYETAAKIGEFLKK